MKKMLVSDYDDTFYVSDFLIKFNIDAIKRFRENGNVFVLSTGRNYHSIKNKINKYKIQYDYLSCLNGLLIFDKNNKLINANYINGDTVKQILFGLRAQDISCNSMMYDEYSITMNTNSVAEMRILMNNLKRCKEYINSLQKVFPNIQIEKNYNKMYIHNKTDKVDSVKKLQSLTGIEDENVYTIGNGKSDIKMISEYDGASMLFTSDSEVNMISHNKCFSVSQYVKKIEKNRI